MEGPPNPMNDDSPIYRSSGKLSSWQLAQLIVDALLKAGLISPNSLDRSRAIVMEEIDARKGVGDY